MEAEELNKERPKVSNFWKVFFYPASTCLTYEASSLFNSAIPIKVEKFQTHFEYFFIPELSKAYNF